MTTQIKSITETDWGIHAVIKDSAVIDNDNLLPIMEQILVGCKNTGKKRILIDASKVVRKVTPVKFLELAEMMQRLGSAQCKIAFIAPDLVSNENSILMENVGFNRGILIRYFVTMELAMDWLIK